MSTTIDPNHCDDCAEIAGYWSRINELEAERTALIAVEDAALALNKAVDDYMEDHTSERAEALFHKSEAFELAWIDLAMIRSGADR